MAAAADDSALETFDQTAQSGLRSVALVWTQLQQIVLTAIAREEGWRIDVLFVRAEMRLYEPMKALADRIVVVPEFSYSVRSLGRYRSTCREVIAPALAGIGPFRSLTWTLDGPLSRFIMSQRDCRAMVLFEDGIGSYLDFGLLYWRLGVKYAVSRLVLNLCLSPLARRPSKRRVRSQAVIRSLMPDPLPRSGARRKALSSELYRQALLDTNGRNPDAPKLPSGSVLYLASYFADCDRLSDAEELEVNVDALRRFFGAEPDRGGRVFWKPHPRSIAQLERGRIENASRILGLDIGSLPAELTIEQILIANGDVELSILSASSSSIYTIKALGNERHRVVCVDSPLLRARVSMIPEVYAFYRKIGVRVIG